MDPRMGECGQARGREGSPGKKAYREKGNRLEREQARKGTGKRPPVRRGTG